MQVRLDLLDCHVLTGQRYWVQSIAYQTDRFSTTNRAAAKIVCKRTSKPCLVGSTRTKTLKQNNCAKPFTGGCGKPFNRSNGTGPPARIRPRLLTGLRILDQH